jgi:5-methyltetrahydrofolate--homocysteine methyltransferase
MSTIIEDLKAKGTLVSDGAWGTFLIAEGLGAGECPELWNATHPEVIRRVASAYASAGADCIITNSFGGSRIKLGHYGIETRTSELNRLAAALVREAVGPDRHVLGSIGPTGKFVMTGEVTEEELYDVFREQAVALESGGADACCVETMAAIDEAAAAVRAVKECTRLEVVCTFTYTATPGGGYHTMMGVTPTARAAAMIDAGADIIGANCSLGPAEMVDVVRELRAAAPSIPILVHPNAGMPCHSDSGDHYPLTPEGMRDQVPALRAAGAGIIGGCCGTNPDHIAAIAQALGKR